MSDRVPMWLPACVALAAVAVAAGVLAGRAPGSPALSEASPSPAAADDASETRSSTPAALEGASSARPRSPQTSASEAPSSPSARASLESAAAQTLSASGSGEPGASPSPRGADAEEPRVPRVRGVHLAPQAWASPAVREQVLTMIEEGRINTVELDLKGEGGYIGHRSDLPRALAAEAVKNLYDLEQAVDRIHAKGAHVVGRLVAFHDPQLTGLAWANGKREQVLQTPGGQRYPNYWANPGNPAVRDYNIDLAVEAAKAGVDDILYDYVRRPAGSKAGMVFPGLEQSPSQAIVDFLAESRRRLRPYGVSQGASVFGVAVNRPKSIAQNIPAMAERVDYLAPMLYPSHWAPGQLGVARPASSPGAIIGRSLELYKEAVADTDTRLVPWLQDFTQDVAYGSEEVRAQLDAAAEVGVEEWLLWDPRATYTLSALEPGSAQTAALPRLGHPTP